MITDTMKLSLTTGCTMLVVGCATAVSATGSAIVDSTINHPVTAAMNAQGSPALDTGLLTNCIEGVVTSAGVFRHPLYGAEVTARFSANDVQRTRTSDLGRYRVCSHDASGHAAISFQASGWEPRVVEQPLERPSTSIDAALAGC
jgi:hypothetical protein